MTPLGGRVRPTAAMIGVSLALLTASAPGCFHDPGEQTTGTTGQTSDDATTELATTAAPDLPDETTTTSTGCSSDDCGTSTTEGPTECEATPPDEGCVVPTSHATLQEAVDDEACLEVYMMPGVYKGQVSIARDVTVSADCPDDVVLDGEDAGTTVSITAPVQVELRSLVITGGAGADGGGIHNAGSLELVGSTVQGNTAARGGGIFSVGEQLSLQSSTVIDNTATLAPEQQSMDDDNYALGGGVFVADGALFVTTASAIVDNRVDLVAPHAWGAGGGVYGSGATVTINNASEVRGNTVVVDSEDGISTSAGGGLWLEDFSVLLAENAAVIRDNRAEAYGLSDTIRVWGGGLGLDNASATLNRVVVSNNQVTASTHLTMVDVQAYPRGGGIYIAQSNAGDPPPGDVIVRETTIADNTAVLEGQGSSIGGGVHVRGEANSVAVNLLLENSTVSGNWASNDDAYAMGGGLAAMATGGGASVSVSARQCTFGENRTKLSGMGTEARGGALYAFTQSSGETVTLELSGTTIAANSADSDLGDLGVGGGLHVTSGELMDASSPSVTLRNTILADNTSDSASANCFTPAPLSLSSAGYNLLGDVDGCVVDNIQNGDLVGASASLAALDDNGGLTETMAVDETSEAHDGGDPSGCADELATPFAVDQRGLARARGLACDIGAYELQE